MAPEPGLRLARPVGEQGRVLEARASMTAASIVTMRTNIFGWTCSCVAVTIAAILNVAAAAQTGNTDGRSLAQSATVTVDSTFAGYGTAVLTDGNWLARGEEKLGQGQAALGNGGNAWVSAETTGEHWIGLEWPQPIALNEVEIWWTLTDWYPRAFRIERWQDGQWFPAGADASWLVAVSRRSVVPLPGTQTQRLRILQAAAGSTTRPLMAAQEVLVFHREAEPRCLAGVRVLTPDAMARLNAAQDFESNLTRLSEPGAVAILVWNVKGQEEVLGTSGRLEHSARGRPVLLPGESLGVRWPVRHSIDTVWIEFASLPPADPTLGLQVHDGNGWVPVKTGLKTRWLSDRLRLEWTFEPVVTRAVRVRMTGRKPGAASVVEIAVLRFAPPHKNVWPDRFVQRLGIQQELLSETAEPSFESAALKAHNMQSARAFVGLKDHTVETGVTWDGTLIGRDRIQFRFGFEQYSLGDFADTVSRSMVDGWRPGVMVEGRMGELRVRQTVLALPVGPEARPVVHVGLSIQNLSAQTRQDWVEVLFGEEDADAPVLRDSMLLRGSNVVLISRSPAVAGHSPGSMRIPFTLPAGAERQLDLVYPQDADAPLSLAELCRALPSDEALGRFRLYWDRIMATPTQVEVPEPRVNRLVKAILAQCFVCGDGNIMPYGVSPSVYEGSLFGIEESYPMLGLALFGYGKESQRYLDGTYLTRDFLAKAESYDIRQSEFRHQQYRNGLQPHYAVSVYRLTRDDEWIRPHLPLLKECSEWTIAQRRRTMKLEDGERPLHWGLLPKWAYGGDIANVLCYPLYPNLCCWRGLTDTAWLLGQQGDRDTAVRYRAEAREYRADIDRAIEGSYRREQQPPFLALKLYGTQPDEELDYYQLFAGCLLDVEAFPPHSQHARWVADYLEDSNRVFCHLPRFRHIGPGALDAIYGKGYWLNLLHDDEIRDFLLAFYAFMAFNLEHESFVSRESNVLYPSDLHQRSAFSAADITDPLVCSSAVALHLVRHMLVSEERGEAGDYSGNLLLLAGTPRAWLADRKRIRFDQMPTHFGPTSLEIVSHAAKRRIEARLTPPTRSSCGTIRLRLRHPNGQPIQSVRVNGKAWSRFDPAKEWVSLPGNIGPCRIEARY